MFEFSKIIILMNAKSMSNPPYCAILHVISRFFLPCGEGNKKIILFLGSDYKVGYKSISNHG